MAVWPERDSDISGICSSWAAMRKKVFLTTLIFAPASLSLVLRVSKCGTFMPVKSTMRRYGEALSFSRTSETIKVFSGLMIF